MTNKDILWTLSIKHKKDLRMDLRKCLESMQCMPLQGYLVDPLSVMSRMSRGLCEDNVNMSCGCHYKDALWTH